jgi:hypothetical protein
MERKKSMIMVHNDVVENHVAELISSEMKGVYWRYEYHSHGKGLNKHPSTALACSLWKNLYANDCKWF